MGKKAELIGCYDFNEDVILVEMVIDETPGKINFGEFVVPDPLFIKSNWQSAYMEQYLNADGTQKLCGAYGVPSKQAKPARVAFFLFKTDNQFLSTPFGDFILDDLQDLPGRLSGIIEYDGF